MPRLFRHHAVSPSKRAILVGVACAASVVLLIPGAGERSARAADWADHPVNQWVRQSPRPDKPAPHFGWEGSGSYDPFTKKWIHYGGHDGIPQGFHLFTFDLESGLWEQRFPNTSPAGVCCVDGANVFDVANRRFVRFPGASLGHGYQWSRGVKLKASAVWLYDPAANLWTNMRPAPYRPFLAREGLGSLDAGATYDPNRELALSFGGQASAGGTNNLFAYDAYANRLVRLPAANPPEPRDGMGLAFDAKHDCLVLFGSQYNNDERTWIYRYDTGKWEGHKLEPHPVGLKLGTYSTIPKMAYDSTNGICLCLTWDTNTNEHTTWAFDAGKLLWTKLNPATEPAPSMSRSRNLSFSPEHNLFILETSSKEGKGKAPEIWTYRYSKADPVPRPAPPREVTVVTDKDRAVLTWADPKSACEFHIYRAQEPASGPFAAADRVRSLKYEKIGNVPAVRFEDKGLTPGVVYSYQVRAVTPDAMVSEPSVRARTEPRVLLNPVVSVVKGGPIELTWNRHPASDVIGYNVYRGSALFKSVKKGTLSPWRDNDPEYAEPTPVELRDITNIEKLTKEPIAGTNYTDGDTARLSPDKTDPADSRFNVFAYIVTAVNRLGVESGPSPYALTFPSAPTNVLCRERGETAELKWDANPEKGIAGYHLYKLGKGVWEIIRVTDKPIAATTFTHQAGRGTTRYWVVAVDALGQEGEPSSPVWFNQSYKGFHKGDWHQ